jgi:hypothetical protein
MMKNLILGFALVSCALACKTEKTAAVNDPSAPNAPAAECSTMKGECSAEAKAECSEKAKADCAKTCPMTKPTN